MNFQYLTATCTVPLHDTSLTARARRCKNVEKIVLRPPFAKIVTLALRLSTVNTFLYSKRHTILPKQVKSESSLEPLMTFRLCAYCVSLQFTFALVRTNSAISSSHLSIYLANRIACSLSQHVDPTFSTSAFAAVPALSIRSIS